MKRELLILLFLSAYSLCFSQQSLDKAYLKCQYEYILKSDTLSGKTKDDLLILQVGNNMSKCYSYYSNEVDSLNGLPNGDKIAMKMISDAVRNGDFMKGLFPHKRMKEYIYKNYPRGKMTVTDGLVLQDYVYEDELSLQQWEMHDSTKIILDYPCQMATCHFRGRQWTAWFATDVPISDGPWKLSGLPGLIMEAYDRGSQYVFTIVGLQKVDDVPIFFSKTYVGSKRFEKTNRIDFLKAKKRYLMDISGYIDLETGIDLSGGTPPKIMRYDLLELDYK